MGAWSGVAPGDACELGAGDLAELEVAGEASAILFKVSAFELGILCLCQDLDLS